MACASGERHQDSVLPLWQRVRWLAAGFACAQFAAYDPPPGLVVPVDLRAGVLVTVGALVAANVLGAALRRAGGRAVVAGDLVGLAADLLVTLGLVVFFAFDPGLSVWALLVVPILEASCLLGPASAGAAWALAVAAVAGAQLLGQLAYGVAMDGSSLAYRAGVLLLVAAVSASQAAALARHLHELEHARRQLAQQAESDELTGLPRRRAFLRALHAALRQHRGGKEAGVAVLYVDCDGFKRVNDTHGHAAGDAVLVEVAARLRSGTGPGDLVARLGGDEFAVLLSRGGHGPGVGLGLEQLAARLAEPYPLPSGAAATLSASLGLAEGQVGDDPDGLLARADAAMYVAKASRRARTRTLDAGAVHSGPSLAAYLHVPATAQLTLLPVTS